MDLLGARKVPYMSRSAYLAEALHMLPWAVVVGMAEGEVAAVVVAKTFGGSAWLIGIAVAAQRFANLVSLVWGMLCIGRRKRRVLTILAAATVLCITSVAFTPRTSWGGWVFVGQMVAVQVFLSGVVTVRTALWKSNYPGRARGQITAKLQVIRAVVSIGAMIATARLFDSDPDVYRIAYPVVAAFGALGVVLLQRIHVRRERAELSRVAVDNGGDFREGVAEPFSLAALLRPGNVLGQMYRVLREDRRFYRYCKALMFTGMGNLMIFPVIATIITLELKLSYLMCIGLLSVVPRAVNIIALYLWAPYFDRVGVVRFRVAHGIVWLSHMVLGTIGTVWVLLRGEMGATATGLALGFYVLSRVAMGFGLGGGALAWHLGHLHFAKPADAEVYMGVHVTLTGLRGLVMPFLGIWLWTQTGIWAWLLATAFSFCGLMLYAAMARDEEAGSS